MFSPWRLILAFGVVMAMALPVHAQSEGGSESSPPPDELVDLSNFVGDWSHHGVLISIADDGSASALWREYQWCGLGIPDPCDRIEGGRLISGGRGFLMLTAVAPDLAQGDVTLTNDEMILREGPVTLKLMPYGMAALQQDGQDELILCGPRYLDEAPPDLLANSPCGA